MQLSDPARREVGFTLDINYNKTTSAGAVVETVKNAVLNLVQGNNPLGSDLAGSVGGDSALTEQLSGTIASQLNAIVDATMVDASAGLGISAGLVFSTQPSVSVAPYFIVDRFSTALVVYTNTPLSAVVDITDDISFEVCVCM